MDKRKVIVLDTYRQGNSDYLVLKDINSDTVVNVKRSVLKTEMQNNRVEVLNMKIRSDGKLFFDNSFEEKTFYMLICENINSMNRMDINTDIPFLFLSKLSELMNKPKKPVWYVSEEEDFYKHLVNLYKYYCSFLDDVDMHFTLFGKVTKILDYRASNKKKLQEARESNIVYFKNVLLKQLPNKYLNSNHIVNFKADLGNPLAFRHLVNLLEDIVKDKTNPNRVDEVKFLILHINKYLSVLVYTQPGFYMYKVFLLKLKENLLKYIDGEQIFPLGDVSNTERKNLFRESIALLTNKVNDFTDRAKELNRKYALFITNNGKSINDMLKHFVVCENVHNTSNTLTYENALKYRTKDIKKYCEKFDDAIREMMHENKKMLYFFTDSVILTNLLKGVTEFVFSPKEATKKFVDDMMNKCLSNKFQILINRLSEIKGSKFQIMLLFFVIIKEEDEKNKELYFNHIDKYLLPAYVELKGFPYVDGYRDMFNVYLSQGDIEFCKMAWLISYDFCYKFFFETKAEMNDVLLQECLLRVFKDLVIKNVYGVEEKGFSKFVFYFNGACGALKIPMLNWNGDNVNCKNIFDYLVVHNKISSLTFEDDET